MLMLSPDTRYLEAWRKISAKLSWDLECVGTLDRALVIQKTRSFPVVIYDCSPETEEWQQALTEFCEGNDIPCVVLTSAVIDDGFRDEVIRLRGYDVLRRNADEDEVVRAVHSAWLWKHHHV